MTFAVIVLCLVGLVGAASSLLAIVNDWPTPTLAVLLLVMLAGLLGAIMLAWWLPTSAGACPPAVGEWVGTQPVTIPDYAHPCPGGTP